MKFILIFLLTNNGVLMKKLTLIIILFLISIKANAFVVSNPNEKKLIANEVIRAGTILCTTAENLQNIMIAIINEDKRAEQYFLKNKGCFRTEEKLNFSFLDIVDEDTMFAPHKILLYRGKKIEEFYTAGFALLENYKDYLSSDVYK